MKLLALVGAAVLALGVTPLRAHGDEDHSHDQKPVAAAGLAAGID